MWSVRTWSVTPLAEARRVPLTCACQKIGAAAQRTNVRYYTPWYVRCYLPCLRQAHGLAYRSLVMSGSPAPVSAIVSSVSLGFIFGGISEVSAYAGRRCD